MNKLVKRNQKGFTLVEIIIVLVIIAILAALLVPSMVKWVDKARDQSALVEGRSFLLAANGINSENYTKLKGTHDTGSYSFSSTLYPELLSEVSDLANLADTELISVEFTDFQVTSMTYVASNGSTYIYTPTDGYVKQ